MSKQFEPLIQILSDRIWTETEAFEDREKGSPFLPEKSDDIFKIFDGYCLDIEKILQISPILYDIDLGHRPSNFHINYMAIPSGAILIDSDRHFSRLQSSRDNPSPPEQIMNIIDIVCDFIYFDRGGFLERPENTNPFSIRYPFQLILYVGGGVFNRFREGLEFQKQSFDYHSFIFLEGDKISNEDKITNLKSYLRKAGSNSYISLHYTAIHADDNAPIEVIDRMKSVENRLLRQDQLALISKDSTLFNLAQTALGIEVLEAITLHFQRQWGDREVALRAAAEAAQARENVRGRVSHDLTRNLYAALKNLRTAIRMAENERASDALQFAIIAAEESVRSGYAAPWLERATHKGGLPAIWRPMSPPSEVELEKLFTAFDRKLLIQCNGFPLRRQPNKLLRRQWLEADMYGETREFLFGANTTDIEPTQIKREAGQVVWPILKGPSGATIDNEGRLAILFAPHTELLRNALEACEKIKNEDGDILIYIDIRVQKNGSRIEGRVRNVLPEGISISDAGRSKLENKIKSMGVDLDCKIYAEDNWIDSVWILNLDSKNTN